MKITLITIAVLLILAAIIVAAIWMNKKGMLKDDNNNYIPDVAEDSVKKAKNETVRRAKRLAEESKDVIDSLKEVGNQIGDIPKAILGEERKGRKK
jgi:uncharacterized protein YxeA